MLIEQYLKKIKSYLKDIINNLKKYDMWWIQLIIAINFVSCKDNDEECIRHSKKDNTEFVIYDNAEEVIEEVSLLSRYQNWIGNMSAR